MTHVRSPSSLNFAKRIHALMAQTEKCLALCYSPIRTEFKFCAYLAAWESTACHDSKPSRWFELWQTCCRNRHRGKAGLTLANSVKDSPLSPSWPALLEEQAKATTRVKSGLRRVFKATYDHYFPGEGWDASLLSGTDDTAVLFQLIRTSFRTSKAFANAEGLEVFLLTLIELFEEHLGANEVNLFSRKAWLSEIYRSRLGGSPETKTLADVASPEVRLERQSALPEKERVEILKKMLVSMRWIANELQTSLASNGPATADANGTRRKR